MTEPLAESRAAPLPAAPLQETQRQRYLKAFGLTPWVALAPLPGAAPSPSLDWAQESDGLPAQSVEETPVSATPQSVAAAVSVPSAPVDPATLVTATATADALAPGPEVSLATTPSDIKAQNEAAALRFTLEAHWAGDVWIAFQQEDPQSPALGRHTGALATSLLAVFDAKPSSPCRFYCPLTEQPMNGQQAGQALTAFFAGLARRKGGSRVLLCLDADLATALFQADRYQPEQLGDLPVLVISSLAEMLADPPRHKSDSWRAMRAHGFDRRHDGS